MGSLDAMNRNPVFEALPAATVLVDTEHVVRAVNQAYVDVSGRTREELLGVDLLEAFPDNPNDPHADGSANVRAALDGVLRTGSRHDLAVQRYDTQDRVDGTWRERYWQQANTAVLEDGRAIGVVHRVVEMTHVHRDLLGVLRRYGGAPAPGTPTDVSPEEVAGAMTTVADVARQYDDLLDEVRHLRRALTSRAVIDQAKGLIMGDRHCSADDAFRILSSLSQDTNVRVADVAAALVYQAQNPRGEGRVVADGSLLRHRSP